MAAGSPSSAQHASPFLQMGAMQSLMRLRFVTRHRIEGAYSGRHLSRQRGGSSEFVDFREYAPGEDLRRIDWKVFGRTGRPYVRLYQDETNLRCTMMLDASESMRFGGHTRKHLGTKLQYAQYLSTALSHLISGQRDQIGIALAADGLTDLRPPAGTSTHVLGIQQAIENIKTSPVTDLAKAMRQTFDRSTGRGVLMVMSDFLVDNLDPVFAMFRLFQHRRWEVIVLHLVHPEEEQLPEGSAYRFEGMENDGTVDCTPGQVREGYAKAFAAHSAAVRGISLSAGCDYRYVSLSVPYLQTLMGFLVEREG